MKSAKKKQSTQKAYDGYNLSYARAEDSKVKQAIIRTVENLSGKKQLNQLYQELHASNPTPYNVWFNALEKLNIKVDFDQAQLNKVPRSGPVIFVANHPYGIVDGAVFLYLVSQVRKDYFLLVHEVLSHEPIMKKHLLPVDFRGNEQAMQTNLRTKELTTQRLNNGEALVIFPAGAVATQKRFSLRGEAKEWPWRRFICTRIHETQCTVVPIFFYGENSKAFQIVSKFSMNLRYGLLLHEAINKKGETVKAEIGNPIVYEQMSKYTDRQELIEFLYKETMNLKK